MKTKLFLILISFSLLLTSCFKDDGNEYIFEYDTIVTEIPVNLASINSQYDDYNSNLPYIAGSLPIVFSSNRKSEGANFDFVYEVIDVSYHERDKVLNFSYYLNPVNTFLEKLFPLVNTDKDEFGPYSYFDDIYDYFMYATNPEDNFDIKFTYTPRNDWTAPGGQQRIYGPFSAVSLNSEYNDLYPTFQKLNSRFYFCSDRDDETFSIYKVDLPSTLPMHAFLTDLNHEAVVEKDMVLSSNGNDKCPSISGDVLVFASDREGGFGGYDLYFSIWKDNQWSEPVNFGSDINSEYDEFRPITFGFAHLDVMIFSSNRPGGKGGFDLYSVIISKHLNPEAK